LVWQLADRVSKKLFEKVRESLDALIKLGLGPDDAIKACASSEQHGLASLIANAAPDDEVQCVGQRVTIAFLNSLYRSCALCWSKSYPPLTLKEEGLAAKLSLEVHAAVASG